jgi:hypothetical protein
MPHRRPQLKLISQSASPEEAAAIVAALERFMRDTAPARTEPSAGADRWQRAAMLEAVSREPGAASPDPWINT